jgi:zinc transport system permease protein
VTLPTDTLLGILAPTALAAGLVALALIDTVRVDLMAYLFGDILAVGSDDILWIYGTGAVALAALIAIWRPLLAITIDAELARVEGVKVRAVRLVFVVLMALVISVSLKIVGIVLITSLLVIPAAAARGLARTPEQMAVGAALIGCVAVALGMSGSLLWDTPSGPSIVLGAALIFAVISLWPRRRGRGKPASPGKISRSG